MIKRVIKEFIVLLTFTLILLSNFSYAEDFYYGDLQSTGYEQMEEILEAKKNGQRIMIPPKISGEYMNEEANAYVEEHIEDFEPYYNRNDERRDVVNDYIKNQEEEYYVDQIVNDDNTSIQQYNNQEVVITNQSVFNVEFIIALAIIMLIILIICIIKKSRVLFIIDSVILLLIVVSIILFQIKGNTAVLENNNTTLENNNDITKTRIVKVRKWRVKTIENYNSILVKLISNI